jgi:hypothetical protein
MIVAVCAEKKPAKPVRERNMHATKPGKDLWRI